MKPSFPLEPVGGEGLLPTGKHGGRDSIRSKVFEEDGGGLEGEGETFFIGKPSEPGTRAGGTAGSGCSHQRADSDACETCKRRGDTAG